MEYLTREQFCSNYPNWFKQGLDYNDYLDEYYASKEQYVGHVEDTDVNPYCSQNTFLNS